MKRGLIFGLVGVAVAAIASGLAFHAYQRSMITATAPPSPSPPPAAPKQTAPNPVVPSFDVVRVGPDGTAVIAGRAEPGAEVTILDRDKPIGTVNADPHGEWVFTPTTPLAPGNHELGLSAKSAADSSVRPSSGVVVIVVPESNKRTSGQPNAGPSSPLAVLLPRKGQGAARALQMPDATQDSGSPHRPLFLDVIQYDGAGHVSISGRAPEDGRVLLYLNGKPMDDTHADANGAWNSRPPDPVTVGQYTVRADLVDQNAKVIARIALPFRRVEVPADLSENQFLVVQPGNSLWRIARRAYGEGSMFTEIYEMNKAAVQDPNVIYPDQVMTLPRG
jgi:hypothetical protein